MSYFWLFDESFMLKLSVRPQLRTFSFARSGKIFHTKSHNVTDNCRMLFNSLSRRKINLLRNNIISRESVGKITAECDKL